MAELAVIIITKNEEDSLRDCLESVKFASEIVVFDSGSTDNTVAIAKEYTDKVFVTDWPGYGPQKERALAKTTKKWILNLDADERLSPELQTEIQQAIQNDTYSAYDLPFTSYYLGKKIRFGDWYRESHVRLFQREKGRVSGDIVHCKLKIDGPVGKLKHKVYHHTYASISEMLEKSNTYSTLGAKRKLDENKTGSFAQAVGRGLWTFLRSYVLKFGFLDGKQGFMLAFSNAEGTYYKYLKLSELP